LPQLGTPQKPIIVAQAGEHGETPVAGAGGHGEGTHTTVGAAAEHGPPNPLAEYSPWYYSGVAAIVVFILVAIMFATTRGLTKRTPGKKQAFIEQCVASINHFCRNAIGEGGEKFAPLVGTIFAFILTSNLIGVLPLIFNKPHNEPPSAAPLASIWPAPTTNISVTFALGIIVFCVSLYVGIKSNGLGAFLKHMAGPIPFLAPLIFPIELISFLVRPISLAMRLFGNIFGEEMVAAVLVTLAITMLPWFIPIPLQLPMLMFGVFGSIVQAGVFTILTCAYINLAIGEHGDHGHGHDHDDAHAVPAAAH
jgi:F-type H+-transporting ATPase subunit a